MSNTKFDFEAIVPKFDAILSRGLCEGVGKREGQMCIEAAICNVLDLPHGDDPQCVTPAIRAYKIALNDRQWSSPQARAEGLRDLGIAQIGSRGVVDGSRFVKELAAATIRVLLPTLAREHFRKYPEIQEAADECERTGSRESAFELRRKFDVVCASSYAAGAFDAYNAAFAAFAASDAAGAFDAAAFASSYAASAAFASSAASAEAAAFASSYAASAAFASSAASASADAKGRDRYLRLSAGLALEILIKHNSPGAAWISEGAVEKLTGRPS